MIVKIIAIAMAGAILNVIVRQHKSEFSFAVAIATGIVIFSLIKDDVLSVISLTKDYIESLGFETKYIATLFKIIAVAYLTQYGASICEDVGEKSIAMKVELAGRLTIIIMTAPIIFAVINLIMGILP